MRGQRLALLVRRSPRACANGLRRKSKIISSGVRRKTIGLVVWRRMSRGRPGRIGNCVGAPNPPGVFVWDLKGPFWWVREYWSKARAIKEYWAPPPEGESIDHSEKQYNGFTHEIDICPLLMGGLSKVPETPQLSHLDSGELDAFPGLSGVEQAHEPVVLPPPTKWSMADLDFFSEGMIATPSDVGIRDVSTMNRLHDIYGFSVPKAYQPPPGLSLTPLFTRLTLGMVPGNVEDSSVGCDWEILRALGEGGSSGDALQPYARDLLDSSRGHHNFLFERPQDLVVFNAGKPSKAQDASRDVVVPGGSSRQARTIPVSSMTSHSPWPSTLRRWRLWLFAV
jgi:hypothetical protein